MEEKGLGVYNYFQTKGIKGTSKELAKSTMGIEKKQSRKNKFVAIERTILEACDGLSLKLRTVRRWLEFLSVSKDIWIMELSRPQEEQQQSIIARLSTMEDKPELQKLTYLKIRKDDMGVDSASKFITAIKKLAKEYPDQAKFYTTS